MSGAYPFGSLLLILALAVSVPFVTSRIKLIRVPIVVGETLAGIAVGISGFGFLQPSPILAFLSKLGFLFLVFLTGLEVNFKVLFAPAGNAGVRSWLHHPARLATVNFAAMAVLAMALGFGFTALGLARDPWLMGLILTTTSPGGVVPILKERALLGTMYGQVALASTLISDFVTILLVGLIVAIIGQGARIELLFVLVLLLAAFAAARAATALGRVPAVAHMLRVLSDGTAQIGLRAACALLVAFVVLSRELGSEDILGVFLAGIVVGSVAPPSGSPLRTKLDAVGYGLLIPIFFIYTGATKFDLRALLASHDALLLFPLLIVSAYFVKLAPAVLFMGLFGRRESIALGFLLSSRLSLIIAAAAIVLEHGLITTATNSAIILVAVVTSILSPMLFSAVLPPGRVPRARLEQSDAKTLEPASTPDSVKTLLRPPAAME